MHQRYYQLVDCKTIRIFAYSSTREQSNKRSGTRVKTESETGKRLVHFVRVKLLLHPLPISLLILREKPTVLHSNQLDDIKQVDAEQWQDWTPCAQRLPSSSSSTGVYYSWPWRGTFFTCRKENKGLVQYIHTYFIDGIIRNKRHK